MKTKIIRLLQSDFPEISDGKWNRARPAKQFGFKDVSIDHGSASSMFPLTMATCSAFGCDQPGPNLCSSCGIASYCSIACQTQDWPYHHENCQGQLLQVGKAHLDKAKELHHEQNWVQTLRYSELAITKLKQLDEFPHDVVEIIDHALRLKYNALCFLDQHKEALECAKERYGVWAMRKPGMIFAAFTLIDSLIHNKEYINAEFIASTVYLMIIDKKEENMNDLPEDQRQSFLAHGSRYLALTTRWLAGIEGMTPEQQQKAGKKAIMLARKAMEIQSQLHGTESTEVANEIGVLADVLSFFNGIDGEDEVLRLYEQVITIYSRIQGSSSINVAVANNNLGAAYEKRADRARNVQYIDRCLTNLELALPHYREAEQTYRVNNHIVTADRCARRANKIEEKLRQIVFIRAATTTIESP